MKSHPATFKLGIGPEVAHEARSCITAVLYLAELFRNEGTLGGREYEGIQTSMAILVHLLEKSRNDS